MTAGRTVNAKNKEWGTPQKYVDSVRYFFEGEIDLDPCSNEYSIVRANKEYRLPYQDGLRESWNFKRIYVNPPYGADRERGTRIIHWLHLCDHANKQFGSEVLALIPVSTNTLHWKKHIFGSASCVCFIYDTRLKFLVDGLDEGKGAPMSCAMAYWGKRCQQFEEIFGKHGAVIHTLNIKHPDIT